MKRDGSKSVPLPDIENIIFFVFDHRDQDRFKFLRKETESIKLASHQRLGCVTKRDTQAHDFEALSKISDLSIVDLETEHMTVDISRDDLKCLQGLPRLESLSLKNNKLICEIQIPIGCKMQIVQPLETFNLFCGQNGGNTPCLRVNLHKAANAVRD